MGKRERAPAPRRPDRGGGVIDQPLNDIDKRGQKHRMGELGQDVSKRLHFFPAGRWKKMSYHERLKATWVDTPREVWPELRVTRGMICPVGPIHLALYYHNDSGGHWDAHCKAHPASVGIEQSPNWKSTSRYPEHRLRRRFSPLRSKRRTSSGLALGFSGHHFRKARTYWFLSGLQEL